MAHIALVTEELAGFGRSGGIGTAMRELAEVLADDHRVEVILLPTGQLSDAEFAAIRLHNEGSGFRITTCDIRETVTDPNCPRCRSYAVYRLLARRDGRYDFIHFHDFRGLGFYALNAKRQGHGFSGTTMVVQLHGPSRWVLAANQSLFTHVDELAIDFMEREAIRWADHVVSPSHYMVDWLATHGYALPPARRCHVIKNACGLAAGKGITRAAGTIVQVRELAFFGRHEVRKGLTRFCDAIARIAPELATLGVGVAFIGPLGEIDGLPSGLYLNQRMVRWDLPIEIQVGLDRDAVRTWFAARPATLAVMPSSEENSPYALVEAMLGGVPFVATVAGGGGELIDPAYHSQCLVDVEPGPLAQRLLEAVRAGIALPASAESPMDIAWQWRQFHSVLAPPAVVAPVPERMATTGDWPRVLIGITHYERPAKLIGAIVSAARQTYPNIEIVVVDDGSSSPATQADLDVVERLLSTLGGRLIRRENGYLGAARNTVLSSSQSDYVLFLDDDDLLFDDAVERLVASAQATGADITNCLNLFLEHDQRHAFDLAPERFGGKPTYLPLGGPLSMAPLANVFGAATALIRRDVLVRLGGYSELRGVGYEDYELYVRALQVGATIAVLPEPLYLYETGKPSMISATSAMASRKRVIDAIVPHAADFAWIDTLALSGGQATLRDEAERRAWQDANSPQRDVIARAQATLGDPAAHVAVLAEHLRALAATAQGDAWAHALGSGRLTTEGEPGARTPRPSAETIRPQLIDEPLLASGFLAAWITQDIEAASARLLATLASFPAQRLADALFALAGSVGLSELRARELTEAIGDRRDEQGSDGGALRAAIACLEARFGWDEAAGSIAAVVAEEASAYLGERDDVRAELAHAVPRQILAHFCLHGQLDGRIGFPLIRRICWSLRDRGDPGAPLFDEVLKLPGLG